MWPWVQDQAGRVWEEVWVLLEGQRVTEDHANILKGLLGCSWWGVVRENLEGDLGAL